MQQVKLKYLEHDNIYKSPFVNFFEHGEVRKVEGRVAVGMLERHPEKFELVAGTLPEPEAEDTEPTISLKFIRDDDDIGEYHSMEVSFTEYGQIKPVPKETAQGMLERHPSKFESATEEEQEQHDRRREQIVSALQTDKYLSLPDIGKELGTKWRTLTYEINSLVDEGVVDKDQVDGHVGFKLGR